MFLKRSLNFALLMPRSLIFVLLVTKPFSKLPTLFTTRRERIRLPRVKQDKRKIKIIKYILGIGFPTTVSVNNCVAHFTPLLSDPESKAVLKEGDVAKM